MHLTAPLSRVLRQGSLNRSQYRIVNAVDQVLQNADVRRSSLSLVQYAPRSDMNPIILRTLSLLLAEKPSVARITPKPLTFYLASHSSTFDAHAPDLAAAFPEAALLRADKAPCNLDPFRESSTILMATYKDYLRDPYVYEDQTPSGIIMGDVHGAEESFWKMFKSRIGRIAGTAHTIGFTSIPIKGWLEHDLLRLHFSNRTTIFRHDDLEALKDKWEVEMRFSTIPTAVSANVALSKNNAAHWSKMMSQPEVARAIVDAWKNLNPKERARTAIFCVDKSHGKAMQEAFTEQGFDHVGFADSDEEWQHMGDGVNKWDILCTPATFSRFDHPLPLDCIILADPVTNAGPDFLQQIQVNSKDHATGTCHVLQPIFAQTPDEIQQKSILTIAGLNNTHVTNVNVDDIRDMLFEEDTKRRALKTQKQLAERSTLMPPTLDSSRGAYVRTPRVPKVDTKQGGNSNAVEPGVTLPKVSEATSKDLPQSKPEHPAVNRNGPSALDPSTCITVQRKLQGKGLAYIIIDDGFVQELGVHGYVILSRVGSHEGLVAMDRRFQAVHYSAPLHVLHPVDMKTKVIFPPGGLTAEDARAALTTYLSGILPFRETFFDTGIFRGHMRKGAMPVQRQTIMHLLNQQPKENKWPADLQFKVKPKGDTLELRELFNSLSISDAATIIARLRFAAPGSELGVGKPGSTLLTNTQRHQIQKRVNEGRSIWSLQADIRKGRKEKREAKKAKKRIRRAANRVPMDV